MDIDIDDIDMDNSVELNQEETLKIAAQMEQGAYLSISEMSNGEYRIQAHQRLPGGKFWKEIGKFFKKPPVRSILIGSLTTLVTIVYPPASVPTAILLEESLPTQKHAQNKTPEQNPTQTPAPAQITTTPAQAQITTTN